MKTLDVDQLIMFHNKILKATGGSEGVRINQLLKVRYKDHFQHLMVRICM